MPILLLAVWRLRSWTWRQVMAEAAIGLSLLTGIWAAYASLHLCIYGAEISPYLRLSSRIGYDFSSMPEKAMSVFLDPKPLYGVGASLLQESPWVLLTPYGAFLLVARWKLRGAVVVTTMLMPLFLYTAYVDLTPYSFWKYHNVHYYSLPLLLAGLCSAYAAWEVYRKPKAAFALLAFAVPILSVSYQTEARAATATVVDPQTLSIECTGCGSYRALHLKGMSLDPYLIYQSVMLADADLHSITAEGKRTRNIYDFRTVPLDDGVRIVFSEDVRYENLQVQFAVRHGFQQNAAGPDVLAISGRFGLKTFW